MRRFFAGLLIPLLATSLVPAAAAAQRPAPGLLSVVSDPPGASVYVDGELRGATPLNFERLTAGDHRVSLVRVGYLDNSRMIRLQPGDSRAVQVKLTPQPAQQRLAQIDETKKLDKQGGGKKKLWIGLGVLGAGAATYALLPKNKAPVPGTIDVSPSGTGLMAVTAFSFTAQGASDADGDSLSYAWDFGDGGSGSGQTVTHVFNTSGSFNVGLTVSDGKKSATAAARSVTVRDVNGTWVSNLAGVTRTWVLAQAGTRVTGSYTSSGAPGVPGMVNATLTSPRSFNGTAALTNFAPFIFSGTFNEQVSSLTGRANQSGFNDTAMTFTRQ